MSTKHNNLHRQQKLQAIIDKFFYFHTPKQVMDMFFMVLVDKTELKARTKYETVDNEIDEIFFLKEVADFVHEIAAYAEMPIKKLASPDEE